MLIPLTELLCLDVWRITHIEAIPENCSIEIHLDTGWTFTVSKPDVDAHMLLNDARLYINQVRAGGDPSPSKTHL